MSTTKTPTTDPASPLESEDWDPTATLERFYEPGFAWWAALTEREHDEVWGAMMALLGKQLMKAGLPISLVGEIIMDERFCANLLMDEDRFFVELVPHSDECDNASNKVEAGDGS